MTLSYTLTLDDLVAFNVYHYWQWPGRRFALWRQLPAFMLLWAGYSLWILGVAAEMAGTGVASISRGLLPLLALPPALMVVYPLMPQRALRRRFRRFLSASDCSAMLGPCELSIGPEGLTESTTTGRSHRHWRSISKVVTCDQHILMYMGGFHCYIVPKRAFGSESDKARFLSLVGSYRSGQADGEVIEAGSGASGRSAVG